LIDRFGDRALQDVKTADIEDFIAHLKLPRVVNRQPNRTLSPASINRTFELLRHMMNWAVGREYLERSPFRRGTETLIRKQHEDNQRRRRLSEEEESKLLAVATPFLKSMIITALDTGMRHGEMLALRFGDVDWHDLRHEYASRLVERGVPLAQVRDLLGHASITTTERYDNQKLENLQPQSSSSQYHRGARGKVRRNDRCSGSNHRPLPDRSPPGSRRNGRSVSRRGSSAEPIRRAKAAHA
jgi:integrase